MSECASFAFLSFLLLFVCRSGHVFLWDSGSTVGDITGHSKFINSISFKPNRPYRLVTAGEDRFLNWYEGPPFKYKNSIREHTRFANCVRFSPTGNLACSGGADGLVSEPELLKIVIFTSIVSLKGFVAGWQDWGSGWQAWRR